MSSTSFKLTNWNLSNALCERDGNAAEADTYAHTSRLSAPLMALLHRNHGTFHLEETDDDQPDYTAVALWAHGGTRLKTFNTAH